MQDLKSKFLNMNNENKILYNKAIIQHDNNARNILKERFENYLFKIHAVSYLSKTIVLNARNVKNKYLSMYQTEELTLNTIDMDSNVEKIDKIPDTSLNMIEIITKPIIKANFQEVFLDIDIINAINRLTYRQKEIIYLKYIEDLEEKEIAKYLNISVQAVYKTITVALNKIRAQLGGELNNGVC